MKFIFPVEYPESATFPLIDSKIPAGFPSPAADYVETRIDLNKLLIKHPSFTFFAYAEGDSMFPLIKDGNLLVVDRKVDQPNGCTVLASVNNTFCVKHLHKFPDGSIELRPHNPKFESINLPCEFEGEFEIFGRVIKAVQDLEK
jgi:DNA polymerase V